MNTRQKEILRMLLSAPRTPFVVRDIAMRLNCSEKTIRNDFDEIERDLSEVSQARLIRKPGIGVVLDAEEQERAKIADHFLWSAREKDEPEDKDRMAAIAYRLLMETKPVTLQELADAHFVNKAVIKKELDNLGPWLEQYGLTVVSKQKVGITLEGKERDKRAALSKLTLLTTDSGHSYIKKQFSPHEVELVARELKELEQRVQLSFTDEAFDNLLIHTLLMIRRTKLKQPIHFSEQEKGFVRGKPEYGRMKEFTGELERRFAVRFNEDEVAYLTAHMMGAKIRSQARIDAVDSGEDPTQDRTRAREFAERLIQRVSALTLVDFSSDPDLAEGLSIHLYSTINRLLYGLTVSNPMLHDIKKMYPYMFDMVIYAAKEAGADYPFVLPEEEAAYLTLHFQAAAERMSKPAERTKQVITVCHMGVGMSQILRSKLERKFPELHVLDSVRKADLPQYLPRHPVDFIVSTTPLEQTGVPYIQVSPLLEAGEVKKIAEFIGMLEESATPANASGSVLQMYTSPSLIFPHVKVDHRYELIEMLANELYTQGFVEQDYAHQALLRERLSSTSIGGGIAIPHGDPNLIRESRIAVATLKEPLDWKEENVSVVFMLALGPGDQEHLKKLFQRLSLLSEQPSTIERLVQAATPEALLRCL